MSRQSNPLCSGPAPCHRAAGKRVALILAAAAITLSACQLPPNTTQVEVHFQRVGVVSVAAADFTERRSGAGSSADERTVHDIAAWGVDRAYEQQLASAVESILGATAVRASVPVQLALMNDPATPYVQENFWDYRSDPLAETVRAYCSANSLDGVLVASASSDEDVLGGSYHPIRGAGLYARPGSQLLHLSAALTLIDCATGRPLERHRVASGRTFAGSHGYPVRDLSSGGTSAPAVSWTGAGDTRLQQALIALPGDAWGDTLRGMLRSNAPPAFGRSLLPDS